jgi:DNA-binding transcriptional MerR regulator
MKTVTGTTTAAAETTDLVPIDEVARRSGLRASAIRYYEERGLVDPVSRHSGRRWYGPVEIRRLAIIQYWQDSGLMSLDEIRDILAGPAATRQWTQIIEARICALRAQIERMDAAREFLEHVLTHHPDTSPDGCPHYEALIFNPTSETHSIRARSCFSAHCRTYLVGENLRHRRRQSVNVPVGAVLKTLARPRSLPLGAGQV